jgi:hypothetical protein
VSADSSDAVTTPALSSFPMPKLPTVTKLIGLDSKEEADTDDLKPPVIVPIEKENTEAASASVAPDSSTTDALPEKTATSAEVVSNSLKYESQSNHCEMTAKATRPLPSNLQWDRVPHQVAGSRKRGIESITIINQPSGVSAGQSADSLTHANWLAFLSAWACLNLRLVFFERSSLATMIGTCRYYDLQNKCCRARCRSK